MNLRTHSLATALVAACLLAGCAQIRSAGDALGTIGKPAAPPAPPVFSQADLPANVQVPRGHRVAFETVGVGEISYQCRANAQAASGHAWVLSGVALNLSDRSGTPIIKYSGPPPNFAHFDGSAISANGVATAPSAPGNLPIQLFAANPANELGQLMGITHVQRVKNLGGTAPTTPCDASRIGASELVKFQGEYIFYRSL